MKNRIFGSFEDDAAILRGNILAEEMPELRRFERCRPLGSFPMSTSVRICMDRLRGQGVSLDDYTGLAEDVACDLLTAEACITALASKILDHQAISDDLREMVDRPLVKGNHFWQLPGGGTFDLNSIPLLREYARQIERLRAACAEALA